MRNILAFLGGLLLVAIVLAVLFGPTLYGLLVMK
jgi:hypothetical protein